MECGMIDILLIIGLVYLMIGLWISLYIDLCGVGDGNYILLWPWLIYKRIMK